MTIFTDKKPSGDRLGCERTVKKADMDFIPYRLFSVGPPLSVESKCALAGKLYKPPSEREVAREA